EVRPGEHETDRQRDPVRQGRRWLRPGAGGDAEDVPAGHGVALTRAGATRSCRLPPITAAVDNLETMRAFFLAYPLTAISETPSRKFSVTRRSETPSGVQEAPPSYSRRSDSPCAG